MTDFENMNRRDFLRGLTAGTLTMSGLLVEEITAGAQSKKPAAAAGAAPQPSAQTMPAKAPVNCAVIGLGPHGREILTSLSKMGPEAPVVSICDNYGILNFVKKSQDIVPKAKFTKDYKEVLENKDVKAVFIATPSHLHKQIALDALQAGKHVYCEAPLSHDLDEAKAIAQAGMAAKTMFQPGLQVRCSAQAEHVHHFILAENAGRMVGGRAQWHKQSSWKSISGNPEREAALNWRLKRATSSGLLGEIGIHQVDTATWYLKSLPISVTAYGGVMQYNDGRETADNVQAIFEYPNGVRYVYDASLSSSFDDAYELFFGTDATIMLRDQRGWMFKEAGSSQLGWEVFARKDQMQIGRPEKGSGLLIGSGIALVADATKQLALGKTELVNDPTKTSLFQSCTVFLDSVRAGKRVPVKEPSRENPKPPLSPDAADGYRATVVAVKANEACITGNKIVYQKEWFDL